jgi:predicted porin
MKKNAIALAVGALCIAPAAQAQIVFGNDTIGTVQFYGKLYPQVIWSQSSDATQGGASVSTLVAPSGTLGGGEVQTPGSRLAIDTQNSYIGFRGERKLGSTGLKGLWQIEQALDFDTGDSAVWSNRNSFLGLAGGFGTVKLGNMDTIYKEYGQMESMLGLSSGNFVSASNVLSNIGVGNNNAARFHERAPNSIQYQTPEIGGFQAGIQYSPDETRNDVGNTQNAQLWSMGVKYEAGPLYLSVQHEIHKDFFGASSNLGAASLRNGTGSGSSFVADPSASSRDTGLRFSAAYKLGAHTIGGDISQLKYRESGPGTFREYKHMTWAVGVESKWGGPWRTSFEYVRGEEGSCEVTSGDCSTDGLTGQMFAGGLAYDLDKSTFLYLLAAQLVNGDSARYDNWSASSPARGADVTQVAVGMSYRF